SPSNSTRRPSVVMRSDSIPASSPRIAFQRASSACQTSGDTSPAGRSSPMVSEAGDFNRTKMPRWLYLRRGRRPGSLQLRGRPVESGLELVPDQPRLDFRGCDPGGCQEVLERQELAEVVELKARLGNAKQDDDRVAVRLEPDFRDVLTLVL